MRRVLIVYESKYGNTKHAAEKIAEGVRVVPEIEPTVAEIKQFDIKEMAAFDAILVGSPNHMGHATSGVSGFIDMLGKAGAEGKSAAVFDTYMAKDYEKAVKKMEEQIANKAPGLKLVSRGLSIRVKGMKGPIDEEDLPKCKEFGTTIANVIK
jgi:flavorubredoxin